MLNEGRFEFGLGEWGGVGHELILEARPGRVWISWITDRAGVRVASARAIATADAREIGRALLALADRGDALPAAGPETGRDATPPDGGGGTTPRVPAAPGAEGGGA